MNSVQNYIKDILSGRLEEISGYHNEDKKVRLTQKKLAGEPFKPDYDDSAWEEKELPQVWETDNDIWFRKKIIVPDNIKGINLDGSRLEISGPGYFGEAIAIAHCEMFIDDSKIFESFNWTDFRYRYLISEKVSPGDTHLTTIHFYKRNDYIDSYPRYLQPLKIHYDKLDNIIFELESFIKEIEFAHFLKDPEKISMIC